MGSAVNSGAADSAGASAANIWLLLNSASSEESEYIFKIQTH